MILYLDTSSLLKLYMEEPGTSEVEERAREAEVLATSVIAYPEAHAAFSRRQREGHLTRAELRKALNRFQETWARMLVVLLSLPLAARAGNLAVKHRLRGMDAIHLSSYVDLLDGRESADFLSHDTRLMRAARKEARIDRTFP